MKKTNEVYTNINLKRTGENLKLRITSAGYSVKDIQHFLNLSCPQPIYRWYKGQILPSADHLYALSRLLRCHMEELLCSERNVSHNNEWSPFPEERLYKYWLLFKNRAA